MNYDRVKFSPIAIKNYLFDTGVVKDFSFTCGKVMQGKEQVLEFIYDYELTSGQHIVLTRFGSEATLYYHQKSISGWDDIRKIVNELKEIATK